jgi:hypothetical protein
MATSRSLAFSDVQNILQDGGIANAQLATRLLFQAIAPSITPTDSMLLDATVTGYSLDHCTTCGVQCLPGDGHAVEKNIENADGDEPSLFWLNVDRCFCKEHKTA